MPSVAHIVVSTLLWAAIATGLVLIVSIPLAYLLARAEFRGKRLLSTITGLPLVLPPTAVGFLLLELLADDGFLGRDTLGIDLGILLTWKAVVLACAVMSAPLVIRTARVGFEEVDPRLEEMARTLGFSRLRTFHAVTLPLAFRSLAAAAILGFTRAMGEFGATVIIAGNIPGKTQTLASAIYSAQQAGDEPRARALLIVALAVGFLAIFTTEWLTTRAPRRREDSRT